MNSTEKEIKIAYIKYFTSKRLIHYLDSTNVNRTNFHYEHISLKSTKELFDLIYQDAIKNLELAELIKNEEYDKVLEIINAGGIEDENKNLESI